MLNPLIRCWIFKETILFDTIQLDKVICQHVPKSTQLKKVQPPQIMLAVMIINSWHIILIKKYLLINFELIFLM